MYRILVAEDEARIAAFVEKGLKSHGFTPTLAAEANETISLALGGNFDLLILDLGLPGKDGLEVLSELRGQGIQLPIIILSARDDLRDKVAGFEGGADDYVTKPFRFEELLLRIKARLRGNGVGSAEPEVMELQIGEIVLDLRTRKAKIGNRWIDLPAREFILAETFFRHPGQVMSREVLLDRVWGYDYDPGSNIVDVYVGYLRKKLGSELFETVRGMGYRLKS
ncbi:response regulator transcription factor [Chamaesiphon minutus]|uniref:Response regulator with CheY-like receiver domain and winged-helix DNA-binding domain n=1 Tax=Chamaesiphon minutus (strain ATCC 27169 / PCC 6605) TaxID=1173020 RepID=K9UFT5_CHAP6|nr:response regulator transcription factor [Chamaesiphon minutus]AFY93523.1 response regulator with CheY-like receiver domain and winged-helix DNA-binding domain [Chamaesiphon minutus PCC 6605]